MFSLCNIRFLWLKILNIKMIRCGVRNYSETCRKMMLKIIEQIYFVLSYRAWERVINITVYEQA